MITRSKGDEQKANIRQSIDDRARADAWTTLIVSCLRLRERWTVMTGSQGHSVELCCVLADSHNCSVRGSQNLSRSW